MLKKILFICIGFAACKTNPAKSVDPKILASNISKELGGKYECTLSKDGMKNLCFADDDPLGDPLRKVYIVVDSEGSILLPKGRVHGEVKWINNNQIELKEYSRVLNKRGNQNPTIKTIDITSGKI